MKGKSFRRKCIGVIGSAAVGHEVAATARGVGALICRMGANLVCGGLGGVMEESCRGFVEERFTVTGKECGITIGILPGDDPAEANPFVDVVIPTAMGMARNFLVVRASYIVVSVAGGAGTLSELSAAWQIGKPIVAMNETGGWSKELAGRRIDDRRSDTIIQAADIAEAEKVLQSLFALRTNP